MIAAFTLVVIVVSSAVKPGGDVDAVLGVVLGLIEELVGEVGELLGEVDELLDEAYLSVVLLAVSGEFGLLQPDTAMPAPSKSAISKALRFCESIATSFSIAAKEP